MGISLDNLMKLASERSRTKRRALLRAVTDMFFAVPERNSAEMTLFDQVMDMVLAEVEPLARRELAERLADLSTAPRKTLLRLADDEIAVAEPILVRSQALSDADLEELASRQTQSHLLAIAQRRILSSRLTDILVHRGDVQVACVVAGNPGARLSGHGFGVLAHRAAANDNILDRLMARNDLPERIATELLPAIAASMRMRIEWLDADVRDGAAGELVNDARVMLADRLRASMRRARPLAVIAQLIRRGHLSLGDAVLELADADQLVDLAALIGSKVGLRGDIVVSNLFGSDVQPAMIICRAAGLDLNGFSAVLRLRYRRRRAESGSPAQALRDYLKISYEVATSVIDSVRLREPAAYSA